MMRITEVNMRYTLLTILIASTAFANTQAVKEAESAGPDLWPTLLVLGVSFILGVISFSSVDRLLTEKEPVRKPGEEAYIDQMLAANGTHLHLDPRRTHWND